MTEIGYLFMEQFFPNQSFIHKKAVFSKAAFIVSKSYGVGFYNQFPMPA